MMTRWEKIICWAALPAGLAFAYLVILLAENYWSEEPVYSFFYGLLAFLFVQLAIALWLSARSPAANEESPVIARTPRPGTVRPQAVEKCLHIRLSKDAMEALKDIMAAEEDPSASVVINHLLVRHQRVLRKTLLGDWQSPADF